MTIIGSAWINTNDDGTQSISFQFDEAIMPFTITKDKRFNLKEIPEDKRTDKEKSPHYYLNCYIPKEK